MEKIICFDMDGTIVDLYGQKNWLENLLQEKTDPYEKALPMYDMQELRKTLLKLKEKGWKVAVISWTAKNSTKEYHQKVRQAKKEWLEKYNFPADYVHLVKYGTTKAKTVKGKTNFSILIDDNKKILKGWHLGATINPTEQNIFKELRALA